MFSFKKEKNNLPIVLFIPSLRCGGAEKVFINLAEGLQQYNVKPIFFIADASGPFLKNIENKFSIINCNVKHVYQALPYLCSFIKRYNIPYLLSAMDHTNIISILAQKLVFANTKIFITIHSSLSQRLNNQSTNKERLLFKLTPFFYKYANGIIAVSHGVAMDLVRHTKMPRNKISVIYNPVISTDIYKLSNESTQHPWLKDKEKIPIAIGLGRLVPEKNFSSLIKAIYRVNKVVKCRLILLGDGEERENLIALIDRMGLNDLVSLPGYVSNPYAYIRRASVFVLSSIREGLPTALIEALALGVPVVSTNCPNGPAEILANGRYGILVPVDDIEKMSASIIEILTKRMNFFIPKDWIEQFTIDKVTQSYLKLMGIDYYKTY